MSLTQVTSLARQLAEWAANRANQQFLHDHQQRLLEESLHEPARRPQLHVATWMLGTWQLGHGLAQVWQGEGRGFDTARIGVALRRCSLLLRQQHQPPQRAGSNARLPFSPLQGALTALFCLSFQDPAAEPLYELFRRLPDRCFGRDDTLALFTRDLLTLHAGERPAITPRLGPYQEALQHWQGEPRLLAQHLAGLLDLHLQQTHGQLSSFADPPSRLYPLEVIAVRQVREWLGLPTPKVEHALMFTNLVTMRPDPKWPRDDHVSELERMLRRR